MKFCSCIAEYNPFHLGHLKHIDYIKNQLSAEKIVVIMSGNFTQRGEPAVLDKFTRARHAILAGADIVIELPTVFATANAEIFAKGAINILSGLNVSGGLCFGVESGDKLSFLSLADAMNNESKEFKRILKSKLDQGISLAKAKFETVKELSGEEFDQTLVSSPNNILGLEYTKAILKYGNTLDIYPMLRDGDHNDTTLKKGITSATSIREVIKTAELKKAKKSVPPFVYKDLGEYPFCFDKMIMASLITTPTDDLAKILDCTEGLENRIKAFSKDHHTVDTLVEKVSTKRYPQTRIRRILLSNFLGIDKDLVLDALSSDLYAKVLAVNSSSMDVIPELAASSKIPLLTRKSDSGGLKKIAQKCFDIDLLANDLYSLATNLKYNEHQMIIV